MNNIDDAVNKPIVLLAQFAQHWGNEDIYELEEARKAQIQLYDQLTDLGYNVLFLGPKDHNEYSAPLWGSTQFMSKNRQDSLLRLKIESKEQRNQAIWPRDIMTEVDNYVFMPFFQETITKEILHTLDIEKRVYISEIGEGGLVIKTKNCLFYSDSVSVDYERTLLKKHGFFLMNTINHNPNSTKTYGPEETVLASRMGGTLYHIDLEFNAFETEEGLSFVCNHYYYKVFSNQINELARQLKADICIIPENYEEKRRAVNFIHLPLGHVLIPQKCPTLREFVEEKYGKNNVIEAPATTVDQYRLGGGWRCRSNIIMP